MCRWGLCWPTPSCADVIGASAGRGVSRNPQLPVISRPRPHIVPGSGRRTHPQSRRRLREPDRPLLRPAGSAEPRILWEYALPLLLLHALALAAAIPWLFTWTGLIAMAA